MYLPVHWEPPVRAQLRHVPVGPVRGPGQRPGAVPRHPAAHRGRAAGAARHGGALAATAPPAPAPARPARPQPAPQAGLRIRINLSCWIRIQEGKNDPQKIEKNPEFSCFEVLDVLF